MRQQLALSFYKKLTPRSLSEYRSINAVATKPHLGSSRMRRFPRSFLLALGLNSGAVTGHWLSAVGASPCQVCFVLVIINGEKALLLCQQTSSHFSCGSCSIPFFEIFISKEKFLLFIKIWSIAEIIYGVASTIDPLSTCPVHVIPFLVINHLCTSETSAPWLEDLKSTTCIS